MVFKKAQPSGVVTQRGIENDYYLGSVVLEERLSLAKNLSAIADDIREHRTSAWEAGWEKRLRLLVSELEGLEKPSANKKAGAKE